MFLRSLAELFFLLGSEPHKLLAIGFWFANLVDAIRDGDASWLSPLSVAQGVVAPAVNGVPDPTARIVHVAIEAGNDVHMQVHDRLPSSLTRIESNVVAVWLVDTVEFDFDLADELEQSHLFIEGGIEPGGHESLWNDKGVPRTDGVGVTNSEG